MPSPRVTPKKVSIKASNKSPRKPTYASPKFKTPPKNGLPKPQDVSKLSNSPRTRSSSPQLDVKFRPRPICVNSPINIYTDTCYMHSRRKCPICFGKTPSPAAVKAKRKEVVYIPDIRIVSPVLNSRKFVRPKSYIKYPVRSNADWEKITEYDADSEDEAFLESLQSDGKSTPSRKVSNQKLKAISLAAVHIDHFERVMDALEKAAYQKHLVVEKQIDSHSFLDHSLNLDENDVPCRICNDGSFDGSNQIVFCDGCDVPVHQHCYGVTDIPSGPWLCDWCTSEPKDRHWKVGECCLCTELGGALKKTDDGRWCHVVCALWMPETSFGDYKKMTPIVGLSKIDKRRWNMVCNVCGNKGGACVQCKECSCSRSFHVMCARRRGCYVELEHLPKLSRFVAYCKDHSLPHWVAKKRREKEKEFMNKVRSKKLLQSSLVINAARGLELVHVKLIFEHWLKRREALGCPLLRRIAVLCTKSRKIPRRARRRRSLNTSKLPKPGDVAKLREMRQQLEKTRILIDLSWKRERQKREWVKGSYDSFELYQLLADRGLLDLEEWEAQVTDKKVASRDSAEQDSEEESDSSSADSSDESDQDSSSGENEEAESDLGSESGDASAEEEPEEEDEEEAEEEVEEETEKKAKASPAPRSSRRLRGEVAVPPRARSSAPSTLQALRNRSTSRTPPRPSRTKVAASPVAVRQSPRRMQNGLGKRKRESLVGNSKRRKLT